MIKFLTCASYYGTGSSAVTDLISEYDGVDNLTDYEFRFLHDPYGVRDLQYYLIDNPNRHNSGFGLKKFIKYFSREHRRGKKDFLRKRIILCRKVCRPHRRDRELCMRAH